MAFSARMKELVKKYGKVALGVHFSVSFASIGGLYIAIKNNVDVEALFDKVGLSSGVTEPENPDPSVGDPTAVILDDSSYESSPSSATAQDGRGKRNRTAELAASSGGALAVAVLCNKALFPVRMPITIALTPPVARFLRRKNLIKNF